MIFSIIGLISVSQAQIQEKALFNKGTTGAGIIYTTFHYLDSMYEGLIEECQSAESVANASNGQKGLLEVIQESYQELLDSNELADPNDQMYIQRLAEITGLLREQAAHLHTCASEGDQASSDAYLKTKNAAWVRISDLLGLE